MRNKIITTVVVALSILLLFVGCDKMKCRPDGNIDKDTGDWYAGFKCGGDW